MSVFATSEDGTIRRKNDEKTSVVIRHMGYNCAVCGPENDNSVWSTA